MWWLLGGADCKRLVAALTLSVALHLCLLMQLAAGLPGVGKPAGLAPYTARLKVTFVADERSVIAFTGFDAGRAPVSQSDNEPALALPETSVEPITAKPGRIGLPIFEEMGPPYPPPLPTYLPSTVLDQLPQPQTDLDTRFAALEGRIAAGRMVFSLLIDENGKVDEVLNEYSGLAPEFVTIVQEALGEMLFKPGVKDGQFVKSRARIEVNFSYSVH